MKEYFAVIHKDENSDYGVFFPDVPGCFTTGETLESARTHAAEVLFEHIEALREDGVDIPEPSTLDQVIHAEGVEGAVAFLAVPLLVDPPKVERKNITALSTEWARIDSAAKSTGKSRSAFMVQASLEQARQREA
ncbi:type II toxin-antitoxin system HicB family antitoxin [Desulfovibrio inopinatus]|uniref:type II toxin-antitoxin system HicB family antitoxin n=1 Tax=Desulfovibrio inopinatus TaxID=102109 RepID=UPI00042587BA|nr:type II toxin-antitoxin system HicB family antitoxin [Desulfovibrio inopinatus]